MTILTKAYWREIFSPALILKTTLQTIIGSILVGGFFMVLSDFVFQPPVLNGRWEMVLIPEKAQHEKLSCLNLHYSVIFAQKGVDIVGSGEKVKDEKSKDQRCNSLAIEEHQYGPGKGARMNIAGFIENNYLSHDQLVYSYQEGNKGRFTAVELTLDDNGVWQGVYTSQISHAEGRVKLIPY